MIVINSPSCLKRNASGQWNIGRAICKGNLVVYVIESFGPGTELEVCTGIDTILQDSGCLRIFDHFTHL